MDSEPHPPPLALPRPQLFNIYPRLGALLQLHRPVLRKIDEVRAILRALLKARPPGGGPVHSYVDALRQQGQVWASAPPPPPRPGHPGPPGPAQLLPRRLGASLSLCLHL